LFASTVAVRVFSVLLRAPVAEQARGSAATAAQVVQTMLPADRAAGALLTVETLEARAAIPALARAVAAVVVLVWVMNSEL